MCTSSPRICLAGNLEKAFALHAESIIASLSCLYHYTKSRESTQNTGSGRPRGQHCPHCNIMKPLKASGKLLFAESVNKHHKGCRNKNCLIHFVWARCCSCARLCAWGEEGNSSSQTRSGCCYLPWSVLCKISELALGQSAEHLCRVNVGIWIPTLCTPFCFTFLGW